MAIHECHSLGFAHRDIKLENVLLDKNFNSKLADFTFCTPVEGSKGLNYSDTYLGTEGYMAPEIINNSYYGISVDIWALGVLFYFMLFAEYPFKGIFSIIFLGHDMKA